MTLFSDPFLFSKSDILTLVKSRHLMAQYVIHLSCVKYDLESRDTSPRYGFRSCRIKGKYYEHYSIQNP
jgi:hypothetical protein